MKGGRRILFYSCSPFTWRVHFVVRIRNIIFSSHFPRYSNFIYPRILFPSTLSPSSHFHSPSKVYRFSYSAEPTCFFYFLPLFPLCYISFPSSRFDIFIRHSKIEQLDALQIEPDPHLYQLFSFFFPSSHFHLSIREYILIQ